MGEARLRYLFLLLGGQSQFYRRKILFHSFYLLSSSD